MTLIGSIMHGYQHLIHFQKTCLWHIDCAWRGALEFINDKEQKCQIYHTVHILLDKDDKNFELVFNEFKTCTDNNESTQCFTKYFKLEYSQHKHQCATQYEKIADINTNMYV